MNRRATIFIWPSPNNDLRTFLAAPRTILITGASSGIGEALALAYAAAGVVLALAGRDADRLGAVAQACTRARRPRHDLHRRRDPRRRAQGLDRDGRRADAARPRHRQRRHLGGHGQRARDAAQARQILSVNVDGVLNTVFPVLPRMVARGRGQIALMSSLAAFRGLPGAPSYCASKAVVRLWGEALRPDLARQGVALSVICPGFVVSRMTANNRFPMPFLMSAERAAAIIRRGLARGKARIAFPGRLYLAIRLVAALPPGLIDRLLARLPRKT